MVRRWVETLVGLARGERALDRELAARWREAGRTGEYGWVALWIEAERRARKEG